MSAWAFEEPTSELSNCRWRAGLSVMGACELPLRTERSNGAALERID